MAPEDRILVAVDVDGTLLNTEFDDVLDRREIEAMEAVHAAGHVLTFCTGRNTRSLNSLFELSDWHPRGMPRILLNGALVWDLDPDRLLAQHLLDQDTIRRLVLLFQAHGAVPMVYSRDEDGGRLYHPRHPINPVQENYLEMRRRTVGEIEVLDDLAELDLTTALEVGTIDVEERIRPLSDAITAELGERVRVINTRSLLGDGAYYWAEAFDIECNKGAALRTLKEALDPRPYRTVAIGDNFNDLDMFEEADVAVAMGNSPEEVKAQADVVTGSVDQGGAAVVLEQIARGEFPPLAG